MSTNSFSWTDLSEITVIYVLGGPGAGKGTHCSKLVRALPCRHLSVGDILRAEKDKVGSEFGKIITRNMQEGKIGPPEITVELLRKAIEDDLTQNGIKVFLLDGTSDPVFSEGMNAAILGTVIDDKQHCRLPP